MRKSQKGFTLVELLVAMAIIAVLIALAGFGVNLALRSSRDTQREEQLSNIRVAITDYLGTNNEYPAASELSYASNQITVGSTNIPSDGHLAASDNTTASDSSHTRYCYGETSGGYVLSVELENGEYYELGSTDSANCTVGSYI